MVRALTRDRPPPAPAGDRSAGNRLRKVGYTVALAPALAAPDIRVKPYSSSTDADVQVMG